MLLNKAYLMGSLRVAEARDDIAAAIPIGGGIVDTGGCPALVSPFESSFAMDGNESNL